MPGVSQYTTTLTARVAREDVPVLKAQAARHGLTASAAVGALVAGAAAVERAAQAPQSQPDERSE